MKNLCLIAFISAAIQYSLTFTGLVGIDASIAALVVQLEVPFLVLLGAVLLKEQPGLRKWFGIGVAFIGVALIAGRLLHAGAIYWTAIAVAELLGMMDAEVFLETETA